MPENSTLQRNKDITIDDISLIADRAMQMLGEIRANMLAPTREKVPPVFSAVQVAELCDLDKSQLSRRLARGDLPEGKVINAARRQFTLAEARQWVQAMGVPFKRGDRPGVTVAIGNFKGGVSKTTTAMTLAQGLSLRGYRVLLVDTDPQGSLTTLFGMLPDSEVNAEETLHDLFLGEQSSVEYAIKSTYWDGIDLIPASPALFSAEFALPAQQMRDRSFAFWNVLNKGLEQARKTYDVILIDTPPALSYVTINAFMAAEGLVVPLPPNSLDFASSAQFWSLFSDLASGLQHSVKLAKRFHFIHVLLSKVDMADATASIVREWITATYTDMVLPVEIPKTSVANVSAAQFGTVYDISKYAGSRKTYQRAREAYDRVVKLVELSIIGSWQRTEAEGIRKVEEAAA
ncbi:MAG: ParA family protein [Burkholderiales bacterium]